MDCGRPDSKNPDSWIENCPAYARPFCADLREAIFRWEPDLTESVKWNMLCFRGHKLVCGLSGCKKHVGIAFFRGSELPDPAGLLNLNENNTAIQCIRLTNLDKFPREAFRKLLRSAVRLDADPEMPPPPPKKREPWPIPDFFAQVLKKNKLVAAGFASLAPTYQREYLVWLTTAKRPETREKRLRETILALSDGRKWMNRKSTS